MKKKINDNMYLVFNLDTDGPKVGELHITSTIADEDYWEEGLVTPEKIREELNNAGHVDILDIYVNSYGGSTTAGNAIISELDRYRAKHGTTINAYIEGIAASMGSGIPMVADTIYMASNALMMIHKPYMFVGGNSSELKKRIKILEKTENILIDNYMRHFNGTREELEQFMEDETWFTAEEAKQWGLCDEITGAIQIAACANGFVVNSQEYTKLPDSAVAKLSTNYVIKNKFEPTTKGDDVVGKNVFDYDEDLKSFGIDKKQFEAFNISAETALAIAKTSANTVLPVDSVLITRQDLVDKVQFAEEGMLSKDFTLCLIRDGFLYTEKGVPELEKKATAYDKLVNDAIDNAIKSGVRAKGNDFNETKWRKLLNGLDYAEIIDQMNEWDEEAKIVFHAGQRKSQQSDLTQDEVVNKNNYNFC